MPNPVNKDLFEESMNLSRVKSIAPSCAESLQHLFEELKRDLGPYIAQKRNEKVFTQSEPIRISCGCSRR
jgi:hypothetical protein